MSHAYKTRFGSLASYDKGRVEPIADDVKNYAFSNCFEVAASARPYEKNCDHRDTGQPLARVIMKAGDMAAMPAYCRHQGFSPKRSMLLVWENGSPTLVGAAPSVPVQF